MPTDTRPVRRREELFTAYRRWISGGSQKDIHEYISRNRRFRPVGLRTVTTWLQWFREVPEEEQEKDKPFLFHNMETYGMPWESYEEVLELVRRHAEEHDEEPTARQAKWMWRLMKIESLRNNRIELRKLASQFVQLEYENLFNLTRTSSLAILSKTVEGHALRLMPRTNERGRR